MSLQPNNSLATGKLIESPSLNRGCGPALGKLEHMERHSEANRPHIDVHPAITDFVVRNALNKRWQHTNPPHGETERVHGCTFLRLSNADNAINSTNGGAA